MSPLNFNPSNDGYWGDTTSTLDWCETNYEVSTGIGYGGVGHPLSHRIHKGARKISFGV